MKKKLNKKGFTLIELVAVVTIMAILTAIILPNVLKMVDDNKKEQFVTEGKDMLSKAKYLFKIEEDIDNSEIFILIDDCYEITLANLGLKYETDADKNIYDQEESKIRICPTVDEKYEYSIVTKSRKDEQYTRGIFNPGEETGIGYVVENYVSKDTVVEIEAGRGN